VVDAVPRIEQYLERKERMKMAMRVPAIETEQVLLDEETYVTFQRPRRWEREQISRLRAQSALEWDSDDRGTVRQRDLVPETILDSERVCLCLVDSNLADENGEQLFIPGKTCRAAKQDITPKARDGFYKVWYALPDDIAEMIARKLHEWHPPFNWRNPELGEA